MIMKTLARDLRAIAVGRGLPTRRILRGVGTTRRGPETPPCTRRGAERFFP